MLNPALYSVLQKHQLEYEQRQMEIDALEQELAVLRKPAGMAIHEAKKTIKEETTKYVSLIRLPRGNCNPLRSL